MTTHKRWMRWLILLSLLPVILVSLAVFVIDPLQHYRQATFYRPLWSNERYSNPGFAKHYDYDCIIIGTSMVENFIPSEVGRTLSMKVLLASVSGAYAYEEYVLLNTALRTGKVKKVIWGLDIYGFGQGTRTLKYGPGSMPFYLYDDNPFNDYQYLVNIDVLLHDCRNALAPGPQARESRALDPDSARFWGDKCRYSRDSTLESWRRWRRTEESLPMRVRDPKTGLDSMEHSFDSNVLSLVERHPDVQYCFFFPPYSILYWVDHDSDGLQTRLDFKRYVFKRFRLLPNVKLFDFQDLSDITFNLDKYKDFSHYSPVVNKFIVDAISKNQCLVTDDNVEEKLSRLEDQVQRFTDSLDMADHVQ